MVLSYHALPLHLLLPGPHPIDHTHTFTPFPPSRPSSFWAWAQNPLDQEPGCCITNRIGTHICINLQPSSCLHLALLLSCSQVLLSEQDPTVRLHCGVNLLQQIDPRWRTLLFLCSLPCSLFATPSSPPLGLPLPLVPVAGQKEIVTKEGKEQK